MSPLQPLSVLKIPFRVFSPNNGQMPHFVADKIQAALNDHAKPVKGSKIHILGVAWPPNVAA